MSRKWIIIAFGLVVICVSCGALFPCSIVYMETPRSEDALLTIKTIGMALRAHATKSESLPPAVVRDANGRPLYSWRVPLMKYVEGMENLVKQFQFDEPWDSPHNKPLSEKTPGMYDSAGKVNNGLTICKVLVGPGTAFERVGLKWSDFPDGLANTLLIVEAGEPVPWSAPVDIEYRPDSPLPPLGGVFARDVKFLCYAVGKRPGFNAVFADGSAAFIPSSTDEQTIRALITRNGGEKVDATAIKRN